jgi:hypothetical protein
MVPIKKPTEKKRRADVEVPIRVTLVQPPEGVRFSLGRTDDGKSHESKISRGRDLSFDLVLRARGPEGGEPLSMLGEHAHGTPTKRFIPIGVGTLAGQADSCWTRVIKILLAGITPKMVDDVKADRARRIHVRVNGANDRGEPVCATVPLLDGGWRTVK